MASTVVPTTGAAPSSTAGKDAAAKRVREVVPAPRPHWVGDGFYVYPVFGHRAFTEEVSPFLMFDYGAPKVYPITSAQKGVGRHPHRGMETVTVAFQGEVEHNDSVGNKGVIGPGDVQWMTAGRGIIHEEYHSRRLAKTGGTLEMCQIWVNLPRKYKMVAPRYQPILAAQIPVVDLKLAGGAGTLRVIAGSCLGSKGPAETHTPIDLWDVRLDKGSATATLLLTKGHSAIVFVRNGHAIVGGSEVGPQGVALMSANGGSLQLAPAKGAKCDILVLAGEPIDEPIAHAGPFVMNTQAELQQAVVDYRNGKFVS